MKKSEFKNSFIELLSNNIDSLNYDEKIHFIKKILTEYEIEKDKTDRTPVNKGQPWNDHQLELILSLPATKKNCLKFAKIFGRGYGSIEQIYRWASTPKNQLTKERLNDAFIQQIMRVKRNLELRN
ncbi:TPA: hypothetical protein QB234_001243 [Pasteurella multocida]|nr:hypothetical protein [Pasteurella multocida]HDR1504774.1 hypothetical protein [Pasteurella multocida]HDR1912365.1 hypothetical protein [Pasteurella multocida]HDR1913344.1 hypothetical protein [Pasteurella multocida]